MKIFPKTFICTLFLLVTISLMANGLIYTLLPGTYTKQKRQTLTQQTDELVSKLENASRDDIVALMGGFADTSQANILITVGEASYSLNMWRDSENSDGTVSTYVMITESDGSRGENNTAVTTITGQVSAFQDETESASGISEEAALQGQASTQDAMLWMTEGGWDYSYATAPTIEETRSFTMGSEEGVLTARITLAPVEEAVGVILSLLPLSLFMCVIVAVVFSLLYARAITRPIEQISEETLRMTALVRDAKCQIKTKDEFGTLAMNVNGLYENLLHTIESLEVELKKVGAAERAKTDFLRAASHELKTPVTAVSVIIDNMILGVGKYKNQAEWLPKCKELVDRLSHMLRDILDASRLEDVNELYTTESIESICAELLEPYIMIARAKGLSLYVDFSASFPVTVPPKLLGKALSNVFSNAVLYTAPNGRFAVYCKGRSLIVENECVPVSEDQMPRLSEPFYRPDASRSRETGGNGLGLYIADTVLRLLNLDYRFEAMTAPDGMRFSIQF